MKVKLLRNIFVVTTIVALILSGLLFNTLKSSDEIDLSYLPKPNQILKSSAPSSYPELRGIRIDNKDPFRLQLFIEENGKTLSEDQKNKLLSLFVAGLSIPASDWWVNLDPEENDRILAESLEYTNLGRILLEEDYILKQLSSSLSDPNTSNGKKYWSELQTESAKAKIWIVPERVEVHEDSLNAYIYDYGLDIKSEDKSQAFASYIKPFIKEQVNSSEHFADLRQVYSALILASWFKKTMFTTVYHSYLDSKKIAGVDLEDPEIKSAVYKRYIQAYEKGVYDIQRRIAQGPDRGKRRRFFSGGNDFTKLPELVNYVPRDLKSSSSPLADSKLASLAVQLKGKRSYRNISNFINIIKDLNSELKELADKKDKKSKVRVDELVERRLELVVQMIQHYIPNKTMAGIVEAYIRSDLKSETKNWFLEGVKITQMLDWITEIGAVVEISNGDNLLQALENKHINNDIAFDARKASEIYDLFVEESSFYSPREYEFYEEQFDAAKQRTEKRLAGRPGKNETDWSIYNRSDSSHVKKLDIALKQLEGIRGEFERALRDLADESEYAKEAIISSRVKENISIWDKIDKLRSEGDSSACLANISDLLGARISVPNLSALEEVMLLVDELYADKIVAKKSKFIEYDGKKQQYRGINYSLDFGDGHTGELQLKTVATSFISDLEHDIVYKPYLMALSGSLKEAVVQYYKNSNMKEMEAYIRNKMVKVEDESFYERAEKVIDRPLYDNESLPFLAIDNRQTNMFYNVFLSKLSSNKPVNAKEQEILLYAIDELKKDLWKAMDYNRDSIMQLCESVHNNGYIKNLEIKSYLDSEHPAAGAQLSPAAEDILIANGLAQEYESRYERALTLDGEQRLRVEDLGLYKLSLDQRKEFFLSLGKNIESSQVKAIIDNPKENMRVTIINVLNEPFSSLMSRADDFSDELVSAWKKYVIDKQLAEVAFAAMISDIDIKEGRKLSTVVFEKSDGTSFNFRDVLAYYFYMAQRPWHKYNSTSFTEFAARASEIERSKVLLGTYESVTTKIAAIKLEQLSKELFHSKKISKEEYERTIESKAQILRRLYRSQLDERETLDEVLLAIDKAEEKAIKLAQRSRTLYISKNLQKRISPVQSQDYSQLLEMKNPDFYRVFSGMSSSALAKADSFGSTETPQSNYGGIDFKDIDNIVEKSISYEEKSYSRLYFSQFNGLDYILVDN